MFMDLTGLFTGFIGLVLVNFLFIKFLSYAGSVGCRIL